MRLPVASSLDVVLVEGDGLAVTSSNAGVVPNPLQERPLGVPFTPGRVFTLFGRSPGTSALEARSGNSVVASIQIDVTPITVGGVVPRFVKPSWSSSSAGAKLTADGTLWRQEIPFGGTAPVGLVGWDGLVLALNNPGIATLSTFVDKANNLLGIDLVGTNPGEAMLEARRGSAVLAFMQVGVTAAPASNAVYVDDFIQPIYDPDFRARGGDASKYLVLRYVDEVVIALHFDRIVDVVQDDAAARLSIQNGQVGDGGRRFPVQMNATTTPRLIAVKRQAIEVQEQLALDFLNVAYQAVVYIISLTPIQGLTEQLAAIAKPVPRESLPPSAARLLTAEAAALKPTVRPRATLQQLRRMIANHYEYFTWRTTDREIAANQTVRFTGSTNPLAPEGIHLQRGVEGAGYGDYAVCIEGAHYQIRQAPNGVDFLLTQDIPAGEGVWYSMDDYVAAGGRRLGRGGK